MLDRCPTIRACSGRAESSEKGPDILTRLDSLDDTSRKALGLGRSVVPRDAAH